MQTKKLSKATRLSVLLGLVAVLNVPHPAVMERVIPMAPKTDAAFEDFWQRNWVYCDMMLAALHVLASQSPLTCPLVEYLFAKLDFYWHHFEKYPLRQQNARIVLPERSGFGIELDPSKIDKQRLVQWA